MAISKNFMMYGVTGQINKQIVFRMYGTKQIVSAYPDMSRHKRSTSQKKQNERMVVANDEVASIMADKIQRNAAQVRLNVQRNKLYHALLREVLLRLSKEGQGG